MDPMQTNVPVPQQPAPAPAPYSQPSPAPDSHTGTLAFTAVAALLAILGAIAWFVWPIPQMLEDKRIEAVRNAFDSNDFAGALERVDAVLATDSQNARVLTEKALILAQQGSLSFQEHELGSQAVAAAQAAIAADPAYAEAYRALAYAYEIQENYPSAHVNYAKAIELDPYNVAAVFGDAHAHDLQGNLTEAEEGYRAAITLNPEFPAAHTGLGRIYAGQGDTAAAIEELKAAYELAANAHTKSEAAASLANLYLGDKDFVSAEEYAKIATEANPSYPLAWYVLGLTKMNKMAETTVLPQERFALLQEGLSANAQALKLYPNLTVAHVQQAKMLFYILQKKTEALSSLANAERVVSVDITLNAIGKAIMATEIQELESLIQASK